jgi:hypothetical protein
MATKTKKANKSAKAVRRTARSAVVKTSAKAAGKSVARETAKTAVKSEAKPEVKTKTKIQPPRPRAVVHVPPVSPERRAALRSNLAVQQFAYMKAPGAEHAFEVGDTVEVFCDHERGNERVRGWIKGIVVQVDNKMVAVQFRSNVFLTDGWMVPDRILWYPLTSDQIRAAGLSRKGSRKEIPDY